VQLIPHNNVKAATMAFFYTKITALKPALLVLTPMMQQKLVKFVKITVSLAQILLIVQLVI
jgi:hypothetical protein